MTSAGHLLRCGGRGAPLAVLTADPPAAASLAANPLMAYLEAMQAAAGGGGGGESHAPAVVLVSANALGGDNASAGVVQYFELLTTEAAKEYTKRCNAAVRSGAGGAAGGTAAAGGKRAPGTAAAKPSGSSW